jgi:hypothetical protein
MKGKRKFSSFSYDEALKTLGIEVLLPWELKVSPAPLTEFFKRRLQRLDGFELMNSERGKELLIDAFCEEALEAHSKLKIWKEAPLSTPNTTGFVDYLIAPRRAYLDTPLLCVIEAIPPEGASWNQEAKKDKFDLGIAQCLIGMAACISQNANSITVHGIVSSGQVWQFLRCQPNRAIWQTGLYTVREPDELLAALSVVFSACEAQL